MMTAATSPFVVEKASLPPIAASFPPPTSSSEFECRSVISSWLPSHEIVRISFSPPMDGGLSLMNAWMLCACACATRNGLKVAPPNMIEANQWMLRDAILSEKHAM